MNYIHILMHKAFRDLSAFIYDSADYAYLTGYVHDNAQGSLSPLRTRQRACCLP